MDSYTIRTLFPVVKYIIFQLSKIYYRISVRMAIVIPIYVITEMST